jgi:hypothetical protein
MHRVKRTAVHPVSRALSFLVVLLSIVVCPRSWVYAVPIDARIQADLVLSEDLSTLAGDATVYLVNRGHEPMTTVSLWLFPERLSVSPEGLDDVVLPRVFPNGFDAGGVELYSIRGAGEAELAVRPIRPGLVRVELSTPLSPGHEIALSIGYRIRIPERYGPFGRVGEQITLDGGFLPRPPPQSAGGFLEHSPPGAIEWDLGLAWKGEGEMDGYINGSSVRLGQKPVRLSGRRSAHVSLVAARSFKHLAFGASGSRVRLAHRRSRPPTSGKGDVLDLATIDPVTQTVATAVSVLRFLAERFKTASPPIQIVEVPLRRDIAISAPGMLLVSDRAFELSPLERFLRVHRVAFARSVAASFIRGVAPSQEPVERRDRVRDLLAIHLSESWEQAIYGAQVGIREILGPGRFIAAVEDVIRSPQIPFQSSWFRVVDDTDPFRDRFTLFSHEHPNGRIWREKLLDRLGEERLSRIVDQLMNRRGTFFEVLSSVEPDFDVLSYLSQWDEGSPEVNYKLVAVRAVEGALEVDVAREGSRTLREPVTVVATGHTSRTIVWDGAGDRATLRIEGAELGDEVVVDPHFRLVESDMGEPVNARFDNQSRHHWKTLLRGFGFDVNSATGRVNTAIAASLIRTQDIQDSVGLRAYDRERSMGGQIQWWRGLGPKTRANQRRYGLGAGLGASWIKPDERTTGGLGMYMSMSLSDSTIVSSTAPRSGHIYSLSAGPVFATREDEMTFGAFGVAAVRGLAPVGRNHVVAGRLQLGVHWGDVLDAQQWPAGGVNGVRAIDPYASRGRHRMFGSLEWRHGLLGDLSWSLLNLSWIEAVDGVLFGDVATVTDIMTNLFDDQGLFGGVGYGFRVHHRIAGFQPMVLSIDYGLPILEGGAQSWPPSGAGSLVVAVGQVF